MKQVKSKNRNRVADETMDDSLRLPTAIIGIDVYRIDSVIEALTTGTPLICNELFFAVV